MTLLSAEALTAEANLLSLVPPGQWSAQERAGLRRYAENYVRYKDEYRAAEAGE